MTLMTAQVLISAGIIIFLASLVSFIILIREIIADLRKNK